ncbi:MAG: hypothetical protein SGJ11_12530 [Phycisphaerae bacterium]|nr:hypothetical protein [Phycisphaerae bacterium]
MNTSQQPARPSLSPAGSDFAKKLQRDARRSAEDLVATAFVMPVLAELRETNHAAAPFGPTDAEKRLGPVIDAHVAHSIVKRSRLDMVDRIESRILTEMSRKQATSAARQQKDVMP